MAANDFSYYRFSAYLKKQFKEKVCKISVNAGFSCPNKENNEQGCIFCDNRGFSPYTGKENPGLARQIEHRISYARDRLKVFKYMLYFQAFTNTYAKLDTLKKTYDIIYEFQDMVALSIGTRPDCLDEDKLELINSYAKDYEVWIELGLQSIHDRTLKLIRRGHDYRDFCRTYSRIKELTNCKICVHLIIGLPGESRADMLATAKEMAVLKIDAVKIHPLHVVKDTPLHKWWLNGEYTPFTKQEYISLAAEFLDYLYPETVIQRITADCPQDMLIAPEWISTKTVILNELHAYLAKNKHYQGKKYAE